MWKTPYPVAVQVLQKSEEEGQSRGELGRGGERWGEERGGEQSWSGGNCQRCKNIRGGVDAACCSVAQWVAAATCSAHPSCTWKNVDKSNVLRRTWFLANPLPITPHPPCPTLLCGHLNMYLIPAAKRRQSHRSWQSPTQVQNSSLHVSHELAAHCAWVCVCECVCCTCHLPIRGD